MAYRKQNPHRIEPTLWEDLRVVPGAFDFPGNADPALANWQPGGSGATFKLYEFAEADEVTIFLQLPHNYKQGTDLKAHIHWTPGDRGTAESGNVVAWKIDYTVISINGTFLPTANLDLSDACDGTNDKHQMTPDITVSGTGLTFSSMFVARLYRDSTGDTWSTDTAGNRPMILEFDLHYEVDSLGSESSTSKE